MWKYVFVQFTGYMIQLLPPLFLLYAPFRDESFRISKKRILVGMVSFMVIMSFLTTAFLGNLYQTWKEEPAFLWVPNIFFGIFILAGSLVYFGSFRKEQRGRLLFYMLAVQYGLTIYILVNTTVALIDVIQAEHYIPYNSTAVFFYILATALSFPPVFLLLRKWDAGQLGKVSKKSLRLVSVCSVIIAILTVIGGQMELGLSVISRTPASKGYRSIWMICFLGGNLLTYMIYFACMLLEKEKEDMKARLTLYQMQYEHMQGNILNQKRWSHDLRHHFRTLSVLAGKGQTEKIQEYLGNYLDKLEKVEERQVSRNFIINDVLNYYINRAEEKQIPMKYDIRVKESYPFDIVDMTVLLGNAMENALQSCAKCEKDKCFIHVMVLQYKQSLLIQIENSVNAVEDSERKMEAMKGYGLGNIELVARKYQGCMQAWRERQRFILRVSLNL